MVDWNRVYKLLNDVTPLPVDCGKLCGAACCSGMGKSEWECIFLPGEETMFTMAEDWLIWEGEHSTGGL